LVASSSSRLASLAEVVIKSVPQCHIFGVLQLQVGALPLQFSGSIGRTGLRLRHHHTDSTPVASGQCAERELYFT
jgi:hypothetical protein